MTVDTTPPVAARRETVRSHHGEDVVDAYEWLRDKSDPEVIAHLEAENAWTQARTGHLEGLRDRIFAEIKGRTQETDLSVPVRHRDWWYYTRTVEGQQYAVHGRVAVGESPDRPVLDPGSAPEGEELLLDGNAEAAGEEFFSLGAFDVSPAGDRLAYAVDTTGDERFDVRVKDLRTGEVIDTAVTGIGYGTAWSAEGDHLFYTRVDDAWRPFQVWRHAVGSSADQDVLVYQEDDERFWMGVGTSRDDRHVLIALGSKNTSEFRILEADDPTGEFRVVAPREEGVEYDVEPAGDRLWIVHNKGHRDFELAVAPMGSASADDWTTVLPGEEGVRISGVDAFAGHLAVSLRRDGLTQVQVLPLSADGRPVGAGYQVPIEEEVYSIDTGANPTYDTDTLQVVIESLVTPRSVYDLDLASGALTLAKRQPVLGGYDPKDYQQHRLWAIAADGTRIPISLVARKGIAPDGTAPGLLYGYGSYEISIDPYFSVSRLSYLDRGVVYAVAHVRGGGEMGRGWYESGRMEHKTNTFTDFIACADHVVDSGWVAPDRLAAEGRSAGGLLMGAVVNLAPERFRVVHAGVAFVDALTTILDPSLPLTVGEWEEWGNPVESAEIYALMRSYSPYENIRPVQYPAILATTGLNDTRVFFVEPAKWVARLRETVTNDPHERPILLKTEMVAGHGGKTGRYDAWHETAFEIAFMLDQLGVGGDEHGVEHGEGA
ncbi:S9 family peptidase [Ornithinimicrobium pratense]|uniref:S9 family peptidase n=1 Tax=Ornithinimicrobium pratense TaxID=2593973 RepID=A0A5J6V356_9MICO|nr:S9 family peptidase [Ornithinimicrobium pratense]QFG68155.1 S9 family peptidase [Ornithinimicrobium pratense]